MLCVHMVYFKLYGEVNSPLVFLNKGAQWEFT